MGDGATILIVADEVNASQSSLWCCVCVPLFACCMLHVACCITVMLYSRALFVKLSLSLSRGRKKRGGARTPINREGAGLP